MLGTGYFSPIGMEFEKFEVRCWKRGKGVLSYDWMFWVVEVLSDSRVLRLWVETG